MFTVNQLLIATLIDVVIFFASFFLMEFSGAFGIITIITFVGAMIIPALEPKKD